MKSNAPWSVKGIERDARETAKAAAQREGVTVGEWLNQIIYSASDPNAAEADVTTGEIEGLRVRDLAAAIEHLNRKISTAESRSADAIESLARSLGGVVERLQRIERIRSSEAPGASDLAERIGALEAKSTDRSRIDALKALEKAVGQVAVQFNAAQQSSIARLDAVERRLASVAEKVETAQGVSADTVREAFEAMTARIDRAEKIAREASELKAEAQDSVDPDFVQKTGIRLRILGDEIKRGGDQIRALEGTIGRLSQQIDGAEKRSAEGVHKVAETIADLRVQFASADGIDHAAARAEIEEAVTEITRRTEDRISQLQRSFDELARRLDVAPAAPAQSTSAVAAPVEEPLDLDAELNAAFAEIEFAEEPAAQTAKPAPTQSAAAPLQQRAVPEISDPADPSELDEFGFDLDEGSFVDAPEVTKPEFDADSSDVLAEIREAFGIDPPRPSAPAADDDLGDIAAEEAVADEEEPPIAAAEKPIPTATPTQQADYLREARRAAREAAAKAAAESEAVGKRRQLTPKQRAILAAKLKRKKLEEAEKLAAAEAPPAPIVAPERVEFAQPKSVKDRVLAAVAKMKARVPAPKPAAAPKSEPRADETPPEAAPGDNPKLLGGVTVALAKLKASPLSGGVAGLAFGIVFLLGALFIMTRNVLVRSDDRPAEGPPTVIAQPAPAVAEAEPLVQSEQSAASDLVRPRTLYLDNIAALKSAQTDTEAKAALARIEEAANLGHPPAQLQLGELYKIGQIYPKDLAEARVWFERAANGGNVLAMHRLGVMAARGEGGPVDAKLSIEWFEKAAAFGLLDSQYNLGATYHPTPGAAPGGVQNAALAYFWYTVAAKNGDVQAGEMAAQVGATLTPAEKAAKDAEAAAWAAKTPDLVANEVAAAG
jgi:localization factor PodJL